MDLSTGAKEGRVIVHIDMDCFYVQCERALTPSLKGLPVAVSQYNPHGSLKTVKQHENRLWLDTNGSLIAVSYEARACGVKRNMRAAEARKLCPALQVVQVPVDHGKADLTPYRDASVKIVNVLQNVLRNATVERASIDEVYIDITAEVTSRLNGINTSVDPAAAFAAVVQASRASTALAGADQAELKMTKDSLRRGHAGTGGVGHVNEATGEPGDSNSSSSSSAAAVGPSAPQWFDDPQLLWSNENKVLLIGTVVCKQLRDAVFAQLGFTTSAGIASNKMLAKIASGMHKPNRQTVVPPADVQRLMLDLPISRVQGFGGKLGDELADFNGRKIDTFRDLLAVGKAELSRTFPEDRVTWMLNRARGIDTEPVQNRALPNSIGCSKSFRQNNVLTADSLKNGDVIKWLRQLAEELEERCEQDMALHHRKPRSLTVGVSVLMVEPGAKGAAGPPKTQDPVRKWHDEQGFSLSRVVPMPSCINAINMSQTAHSLVLSAVETNARIGNSKNYQVRCLSFFSNPHRTPRPSPVPSRVVSDHDDVSVSGVVSPVCCGGQEHLIILQKNRVAAESQLAVLRQGDVG